MTDKERLEEIERQLNRAEIKRENLDTEDFQNILEQQLISGNLKWLVKYAREQAERVQELEIQASRHKERIIQCALRKRTTKQTLSKSIRSNL